MSHDSETPANQNVSSAAPTDPQFTEKFAKVIESWAEATSEDKAEEAQAAAMLALSMAAEEALRNPDPQVMLMTEAGELEGKGAWLEAEAVRRKVLGLYESSGNFGMAAKAQMDLSALLRMVGRSDEAWQFACAATLMAHQGKKSFVILAMALLSEASCALEREDPAKALAAASEAVRIIEPGKTYDHMRARALTARAKCLLARGDPEAAALDLAAGWELLEAKSGSCMMPGIVATLANWWEVKSGLEQRLGNLWIAREAITIAIEHRRSLESPSALLALARALEKLGEISRETGDLTGEEHALSEAKSIRESLHLPPVS